MTLVEEIQKILLKEMRSNITEEETAEQIASTRCLLIQSWITRVAAEIGGAMLKNIEPFSIKAADFIYDHIHNQEYVIQIPDRLPEMFSNIFLYGTAHVEDKLWPPGEMIYKRNSEVPMKLVSAAEHHAIDSHPEHFVGDFQDAMTVAWNCMNPEQRKSFFENPTVQTIFQMGYPEDREGLPMKENNGCIDKYN